MTQHIGESLLAFVVLGTLGTTLVLFTRSIQNYILRKKLIERGFVNEEAQGLLKEQRANENRYADLKWGLVILFAGISLIVMEPLDYDSSSPLPYGLFAVGVSLGFLIYYFMVRKDLTR